MQMISKLWPTIVSWGVAVIAVLAILFKARQSGKEAVNRRNMEEVLKGVQTRDKIQNNVTAADLVERKRLRKKWERK